MRPGGSLRPKVVAPAPFSRPIPSSATYKRAENMAKKKAAKKASTLSKMVYYFGKSKTEGKGVGKGILGGKGVNLAGMTAIGLPVPPGFTITTECCAQYYEEGKQLPKGLMDEVKTQVAQLEK